MRIMPKSLLTPVPFFGIWAVPAAGLLACFIAMAHLAAGGSMPNLGLGVSTAQASPNFTLEDFFKGKTYAKGRFVSKINKTSRSFDVYLTGKWNGKVLTLREDFVYSDGEKDRKTWRFTKTGPTTYSGTREDVIGATKVIIKGNIAKFNYDVLLPRKGKKPIRVHFRDVLELKPNGILENTARVSKLGIPVARVGVNFARSSQRSKLRTPAL